MPSDSVRYLSAELNGETSNTYSFVFELITPTGQVLRLRARYSTIRVMALAVQQQHPELAAVLPPFPQRLSMSVQTPAFLSKRGSALARYLQEVFGDRTLASLTEVKRLRLAAIPNETFEAMADEPAEVVVSSRTTEAPSPGMVSSPAPTTLTPPATAAIVTHTPNGQRMVPIEVMPPPPHLGEARKQAVHCVRLRTSCVVHPPICPSLRALSPTPPSPTPQQAARQLCAALLASLLLGWLSDQILLAGEAGLPLRASVC